LAATGCRCNSSEARLAGHLGHVDDLVVALTCLLSGELEWLEPVMESETLPELCVRLSETDDPTELAARQRQTVRRSQQREGGEALLR